MLAMYDAYDRGDYEGAFALIDEEVEWSDPPETPDASVWRGHDGVREALTRWIGTWDDYRSEVDELIDAGDAVLAVTHQYGRGKGSGVESLRRSSASGRSGRE